MPSRGYLWQYTFTASDGYVLSNSEFMTASNGVVKLREVQRAARMPGRPWTMFSRRTDLHVRTEPFAPTARKTWDFVEVIANVPENTHIDVRVHDGSDPLWWNGAAWAVAGAGDWNTEAELNANLSDYDGDSLAIEVRLRTDLDTVTPSLASIGLAWTGEAINWLKSWIYDGIVESLKANLRPTTAIPVDGNGTDEFDLDGYDLGAGYRITEVVEAYNHTSDPRHRINILTGYAGTVATLSEVVPEGDTLFMLARYAPQISVTTSPDYVDKARVPAVWITDIRTQSRPSMQGGSGPAVIDRTVDPPAGRVLLNPIPMSDIVFTYAILAPSSNDEIDLAEAMRTFVEGYTVIHLPALDLKCNLEPRVPFEWNTSQEEQDDPRLGYGTFALIFVPVLGDVISGTADGAAVNNQPIDAGNPDFPGVGFAIRRFVIDLIVRNGTGRATVTIPEE